jgi:hypothetical protein
MAKRELRNWRNKTYEAMYCNTVFLPETLLPNTVLDTLALRRFYLPTEITDELGEKWTFAHKISLTLAIELVAIDGRWSYYVKLKREKDRLEKRKKSREKQKENKKPLRFVTVVPKPSGSNSRPPLEPLPPPKRIKFV